MGMNGTLRWGLWGTGRISHQVAQDLRLVPGARVTAVGGRRLAAAQQLAALHPGALAVDSLERLIASNEVDALYIATPDDRHRDDALAVLAAGKAVLCEKPLAASLDDVEAMVAAAGRAKVFLMEAMWTRFLPAIAEVKRRVEAGDIGDIKFMQGSFCYADARRGHEPYPSLAQSMLYDRGVYLIALAQHLHAGNVVQANTSCNWRAARCWPACAAMPASWPTSSKSSARAARSRFPARFSRRMASACTSGPRLPPPLVFHGTTAAARRGWPRPSGSSGSCSRCRAPCAQRARPVSTSPATAISSSLRRWRVAWPRAARKATS
jgi:predicted dehydrogenase